MIPSKAFYSNYLADDNLSELNQRIAHEVLKENPNHVLEIGCGTGKNLKLIQQLQLNYAKSGICVTGLDVSFINCVHAIVKNGLPNITIGDESHLRHYCNFDVVFTVSVLDHIIEIDGIIQELQRIANKCVIIAECIEPDEANYYYSHDFTKYGFEKLRKSDYFSPSDNHNYAIYKYYKQNEVKNMTEFINGANDDLAL